MKKIITRNHNFMNRLNFIKKGKKYIYLFREKNKYGVFTEITPIIERAFQEENWSFFEKLEEKLVGSSDYVATIDLKRKKIY